MARKAMCRGKGHGTLEKHGRVWRAKWIYDGKSYTKSTGTSDRRAAEKILEELSAPFRAKDDLEVLKGLEVKVALQSERIVQEDKKKPGYTPQQAWSAFFSRQDILCRDQGTLRNYEQWYWLFVDWLTAKHPEVAELRNVSRNIAEEYSHALRQGGTHEDKNGFRNVRRPVRGTTFNRHMNALALVWRTVAKDSESKLGENPFAWNKSTETGIPRIALRREERPHKRRDMTCQEVNALLAVTTGEMRVLFALGFYTGLRLKDCVLLKWGAVDLGTKTITTRSYKTDEETATAIHPTLWKIMAENVTTTSGYLLPELASRYLADDSERIKLNKEISGIFHAVGIETSVSTEGNRYRARPDCGFHSLRHTFNAQLQHIGVDRTTRQKLMGHSSEKMTEHYEHSDAAAPLALPNLLADDPKPTSDKVAQLQALLASMPEEERRAAMTALQAAG